MLRVRTTFTGGQGAPYFSTFYFSSTVPETQADADGANAHTGAFWNSLEGAFTNQLSWATDGNVDVMSPDGTLTGTFSVTPQSGVGAETGDPLPRSNQLLIRWSTGVFVNGRQVRGRTFVPGLTELNSTNGAVGASTIALIQPAINTLALAVNPHLVVWSRPCDDCTPPRLGEVAGVDSGSVWSQFAVLRSRRD